MRHEVPTPIVVIALLLVLGAVGFYYFYWTNRSTRGAGVTREELRREFLQRAKSGQLPGMSPEAMRRLEGGAR